MYNPQGIVKCGKVKDRGKGATTNKKCGAVNIQSHTGYPGQRLEFSRDLPSVHPTQKPVDLMKYLVRTYSKAGDTVLDFTMGTGSTGIACAELGRNFIGIEMDKQYFDTAKERIKQARARYSYDAH